MKKIVELFVEFPIYAKLLIAFVLLAGGISFLSMNKAFFPETESRIITVSVFYPGASPIEMEEGVTSRIEEAVRGIIGIKEITSTSVENSARITIETTGQYDINETLQEVKNAVDGVSSLPTAAERPIVAKRRSRARAISLNVIAKEGYDVDLMTLKKYAQGIEEDFFNSGQISQVSLSGYPQLEISVEITEDNLLRYQLTFDQIMSAIQSNNQDVSGGQIRSDDEELLIRLRSRSSDPNKIGDIILKANEDGSYLRIRDVALVKRKFAENSNKSWVNGQPAVSINVEKLPEEDLEAITDYVRDYIEEFNAENDGVAIVTSRAFLDVLNARLKLLTSNGLIGLVLVVIALGLFLNFKLSLWVAFGIPFSFLGMFIITYMLGVTINMMSIFGMILVIGILVDTGIVIAENIFVHFERGKSPMKSAVDGTLEVLPAVMTSVTTTLVAFIPLLFLGGTNMEMMFEMALVVLGVLVFSLFEAFLVIPAFLSSDRVLNTKSRDKQKKGLRKYTEAFFIWLRDNIYYYMLKYLLKWRWAVAGIPVALVLVTMGLFLGGHIKNTFFPMVDFDQFTINVAFTPGDGEKKTYEYLKRFEKAIWDVNEDLKKQLGEEDEMIERVSTNLGFAFNGDESGAHAGSIYVFPKDLQGYDLTGYQIANMVREKIGPVPEALKFTVGGQNRWGSPVSIGLMSQNMDELNAAKTFLMNKLSEMPQLKDITENVALGKQEVRLKLKPKAYFLGLDENAIARQIRQGFYGGQAQRLQEGRDELRVWVRYPLEDRLTLGQMERMKIKTSFGEYPLIELADYHLERGPVAINRFNGSREIRVEAETVDPLAPVPEILGQIEAQVMPELQTLFTGVRYIYQGQQKASNETLDKIVKYFAIAFIMMIFIMILHFRSGWQTAIVVMMIPFSLLGVFWGHGIHDKPLSIMSLWGMIALTGVVINNAIVYLSKFDGLLLEGKNVLDAVIEAGGARLRPIILTTLTTTIGLFPLILETSPQAQFLIPMAISLAYGVAIGTIFILVFFPVLIMLLNDFKVYLIWIWTGNKPEREAVEKAIILEKRKQSYLHNEN